MALLDFLKNKKEKDKAAEKKAALVSPAPEKAEAKKEKNVEKAASVASGTKTKFAYNVVKEPHISEKGTILGEANKYVFKVYANANKPEIKKAVEGLYNVTVQGVNIITI